MLESKRPGGGSRGQRILKCNYLFLRENPTVLRRANCIPKDFHSFLKTLEFLVMCKYTYFSNIYGDSMQNMERSFVCLIVKHRRRTGKPPYAVVRKDAPTEIPSSAQLLKCNTHTHTHSPLKLVSLPLGPSPPHLSPGVAPFFHLHFPQMQKILTNVLHSLHPDIMFSIMQVVIYNFIFIYIICTPPFAGQQSPPSFKVLGCIFYKTITKKSINFLKKWLRK